MKKIAENFDNFEEEEEGDQLQHTLDEDEIQRFKELDSEWTENDLAFYQNERRK